MCCLCKYCEILSTRRGARVSVGSIVSVWTDFVFEQTAIVDEANNGYPVPKVLNKRARCESERRAWALQVGFTPVDGVERVYTLLSDDRAAFTEASVHGDS